MPIFVVLALFYFFFRPVAMAQEAGDITVCASGCAYSNLQNALNAAPPGSRLLLTAGESYRGNFILPYKGETGSPITIESTSADRLPPSGFRVQPEHADFMPKLVSANRELPVLMTGAEEQNVEKVDPNADIITYIGPHGYRPDQPIAFWTDGVAPQGLVQNKVYYVRILSTTTLRIAEAKTGPTVDLRTAFTGERLRSGPVEVGSRYIFRGIEFTIPPGSTQEFGLVVLGTPYATSREGIPSGIELDRVYIHGLPDHNGPRICLMVNARQFSIRDSRIEHCNKEAEEGKGIALLQAPGPGQIVNNYIEGASINLLMGGDYVRVQGLVSGDEGGIEIYGNHFYKPLRLKYTAGPGGPGNPAGECRSGWYLNTTSGKLFDCAEGGKWLPGPTCAAGEYYRRSDVAQNCASGACWQCSEDNKFERSNYYRGSSYYVKNLFEIKSGVNIYAHGNIFENNWPNADQSGIGVLVAAQVGQGNANGWVRCESILFTNNILRNSAQGIRMSSEGQTVFGMPNRNVRVFNNLLYDIGVTATPSIASTDGRPISLAGECIDCQFSNNTVVSGAPGGVGVYFDTKPLTGLRFANNIIPNNRYGVVGDSGLPVSFYLRNQPLVNNVMVSQEYDDRFAPGNNRVIPSKIKLFTAPGEKNFRLDADSPFSASCTRQCEFSGDDKRDIGANIDQIEMETSGAVGGTPNWKDEFGAQLNASEPRKAVLTYYVRSSSPCSLRVATDPGLRSPIGDIAPDAGDNRHLDTRDGNFIDGAFRSFTIGNLDPLQPSTQYFYKLTCGTRFIAGEFTTPAEP